MPRQDPVLLLLAHEVRVDEVGLPADLAVRAEVRHVGAGQRAHGVRERGVVPQEHGEVAAAGPGAVEPAVGVVGLHRDAVEQAVADLHARAADRPRPPCVGRGRQDEGEVVAVQTAGHLLLLAVRRELRLAQRVHSCLPGERCRRGHLRSLLRSISARGGAGGPYECQEVLRRGAGQHRVGRRDHVPPPPHRLHHGPRRRRHFGRRAVAQEAEGEVALAADPRVQGLPGLGEVVVPLGRRGHGLQHVGPERVEPAGPDELARQAAVVVPEETALGVRPVRQAHEVREVDLVEQRGRAHLESRAGLAHEVDPLLDGNPENDERGLEDRLHRPAEGFGVVREVVDEGALARLVGEPRDVGVADHDDPFVADPRAEVAEVPADLRLPPGHLRAGGEDHLVVGLGLHGEAGLVAPFPEAPGHPLHPRAAVRLQGRDDRVPVGQGGILAPREEQARAVGHEHGLVVQRARRAGSRSRRGRRRPEARGGGASRSRRRGAGRRARPRAGRRARRARRRGTWPSRCQPRRPAWNPSSSMAR